MDDATVKAQLQAMYGLLKSTDEKMMTLYANIQQLDKRDPRFTATMRQYGVLPQLSAFFGSLAELTQGMAPLLNELEKRLAGGG